LLKRHKISGRKIKYELQQNSGKSICSRCEFGQSDGEIGLVVNTAKANPQILHLLVLYVGKEKKRRNVLIRVWQIILALRLHNGKDVDRIDQLSHNGSSPCILIPLLPSLPLSPFSLPFLEL